MMYVSQRIYFNSKQKTVLYNKYPSCRLDADRQRSFRSRFRHRLPHAQMGCLPPRPLSRYRCQNAERNRRSCTSRSTRVYHRQTKVDITEFVDAKAFDGQLLS